MSKKQDIVSNELAEIGKKKNPDMKIVIVHIIQWMGNGSREHRQ